MDFKALLDDQPSAEAMGFLCTLPKRWGRMDRISRLAVVEVGRVLAGLSEVAPGTGDGRTPLVGLIVGTRRGSLATDLTYCASLRQGAALASPLLFSYTLPNIALSEAAIHFGLKGPVYSLLSDREPATAARREAELWQRHLPEIFGFIVGELDCLPTNDIHINLYLVSNACPS